jgi:hypothetical protein
MAVERRRPSGVGFEINKTFHRACGAGGLPLRTRRLSGANPEARLGANFAAHFATNLGGIRRGQARVIRLILVARGLIETEQSGPVELYLGGRLASGHDDISHDVITKSSIDRKRIRSTGQRKTWLWFTADAACVKPRRSAVSNRGKAPGN